MASFALKKFDGEWELYKNSLLSDIGVSEYLSLADTPQQQMRQQAAIVAWHDRIAVPLDMLSETLHKPVLLSEIGYRDTSSALYLPYTASSDKRSDAEQAKGYEAALTNA